MNITENNYTTENSNIPDNTEVNMLDLETGMRQMKNKSPGYNELSCRTNWNTKPALDFKENLNRKQNTTRLA
jgi:hypothetical protein